MTKKLSSGCRALAVVLLLAFALFALTGCSKKEGDKGAALSAATPQPAAPGAAKRPPVPVVVAKAGKADFPVSVNVVGTVEPVRSSQVRSQIGGLVTEVRFREGDTVKSGQVLFQIDQRPIKGNIKQLEAELSRWEAQAKTAEAQLRALEAQAKTAESQVRTTEAQAKVAEAQSKTAEAQASLAGAQEKRYQALMEKDFVTKEQFEQVKTGSTAAESSFTASKATIEATRSSAEASRSNAEALKAQVEAARASVESAKASGEATRAAIENAKIQLGYTTLTAPFSGLAGSISARAGDLVKANDASLVTLNQINPILVRFAIPEGDLPDVMRYRKEGTLKVKAELPGRLGETRQGKIVFVDNAVDRATGTIALKAEFENTDGALWPGQFTNLRLTLYTLGGAVLAPSPAIQTGQKGPYLYVVGQDMTASLRPVRPGPTEGSLTVIEEGLAADETVVVDGQLKLTPGAMVMIKPPVGASPEASKGAAQ